MKFAVCVPTQRDANDDDKFFLDLIVLGGPEVMNWGHLFYSLDLSGSL